MKKKLYFTRCVKLLAFALAVIITTMLLQSFILQRLDNNSMRMEAFYLEEKESLDAVVIGASDVYAGYCAPYAYDKFGLTSYPYATQSAPANATLPQIKEVIKYQNPKMIIVEVNAFLYKDTQMPNEGAKRMFADNIPRDEIWRDYLEDAIDDDQKLEYYLPIVKYHSSWTDYPWKLKFLSADMKLRSQGYSLFRGYKTVANAFKPTVKVYNDQLANNDKTYPLSVCGERYLRETLEYLQENDIHNVVFMRFPHIVRKNVYTRFRCSNELGRIIESYGYDFVNLERYGSQEGFDTDRDFYNWDHLNIYGSEKLTDYIGNMLVNEYGITPAELTEEQKKGWEDSVNYYHMIYNYSDSQIQDRLKLNKSGNGGVAISEEDEMIGILKEFAQKHPGEGKYPVVLDE